MVTSRPLDLVNQQFQGACQLDINAAGGDVWKYIDSSLRIRLGQTKNEILQAQLAWDNHGLQDSIMEKIVANSRGMSIQSIPVPDYCTHRIPIPQVLDGQAAFASQRSASGVWNTLKNLPMEINATDDEAMQWIQSTVDWELAEHVLSSITYSHTPLSYKELQHALAQMTDMINKYLVDKCFLIDICAGLVIINDQTHIIQLACE